MVELCLYVHVVGMVTFTPAIPAYASLSHASMLFGCYGHVIAVLEGVLLGDDRGTG